MNQIIMFRVRPQILGTILPMSSPTILAIDLGTSGPKVVIVNAEGQILSTATRAVRTIMTEDGGVEHDPESVWRAVTEAISEALSAATVPADSVRAISCDSHYSSIVPVDTAGNALMNIIVWMDQRASKNRMRAFPDYKADSLWRQLRWVRIHGIPPLDTGADNISRIRWIQHARPEMYERTAAFLEPMDYIALRLTGRATANQCSSFMIQLLNNHTLDVTTYDETLLRYAGIDREKLPELVPVGGEVGTVLPQIASSLGVRTDTVVLSGLNDTQAAFLGCGAFHGDRAGIGIGTSSVLFSNVPFKKTDIRNGIFTQPSPVPNTYTLTAENGIAGKALEHFLTNIVYAKDALADHSTSDRFAALDAAVGKTPPGSRGVVFLPWVGGALVPVADNDVRGGFLNMGVQTTRDDLARAVLEGVALGFKWILSEAETAGRKKFERLVFYGGGALSPVWSQIIADALQVPVARLAHPRLASSLGVASLARVRLGWTDFGTLARETAIQDTFDPNPANRRLYEDRFATFKDIFRRNRPVFKHLNNDPKS